MNILLDGRLYRSSTGGIGRYSRELVKNLLEIDKETQYTLLLTPADAAECNLKAPNLKKVVTPITHFSLAEQLQLPAELDRLQPDLVHFLNFNHPLRYTGRFITTIHDLTMTFFPVGRQKIPVLRQAYLAVMNHAAQAAVAVIVPSQGVKDDVVKHIGVSANKVQAIYEGADGPKMRKAASTKKDETDQKVLAELGITKPYLLFVSQWRPHKGLGVLIEAFNSLKQELDIQLVITGKPNNQFPAIPAAIEASPYRADIITPGFVSDPVLDTLYADAQLFVFPSWYEGFGLPPLEAMARGVAVAASNTSVMPEILGDGAVYFDPRDAKAMAKRLKKTLADPGQLAELRQKGLAQAKKYSWKKMAEETLALYKRVLDTPTR